MIAVSIFLENTFDGRVFAPALAAVHVPRVTNHQFEVVIVVNAAGDVLVVVLELFSGHFAVLLVGLPDAHEISQDFFLSFAPALEIGVEVDVVGHFNVGNCHKVVTVLVKDGVSLVD